jgi:hypothetical protein
MDQQHRREANYLDRTERYLVSDFQLTDYAAGSRHPAFIFREDSPGVAYLT